MSWSCSPPRTPGRGPTRRPAAPCSTVPARARRPGRAGGRVAAGAAHLWAADPRGADRPLRLVCRPVRDLLVAYLRGTSARAGLHQRDRPVLPPGRGGSGATSRPTTRASTASLPAEVAAAWKQRMRIKTKRSRAGPGKDQGRGPRNNGRACLAPVRAFYWTWPSGPWRTRSLGPVGRAVPDPRGGARPTQGDAVPQVADGSADPGTAPVLPMVVPRVDQRHETTRALLGAGHRAAWRAFPAAGTSLVRSVLGQRSDPDRGLGRGPRHRQPPRPDPRGGPRVLDLGDGRGAAPHRDVLRGSALRWRFVPRVCAAQRLMIRGYRVQQVWCKWAGGGSPVVVAEVDAGHQFPVGRAGGGEVLVAFGQL